MAFPFAVVERERGMRIDFADACAEEVAVCRLPLRVARSKGGVRSK